MKIEIKVFNDHASFAPPVSFTRMKRRPRSLAIVAGHGQRRRNPKVLATSAN